MSSIRVNGEFNQSHPQVKFVEASLGRRVTELAVNVLCGLWRTLGSYFSQVSLSEADKANISQSSNLADNPTLGEAVRELRCQKQVGPSSMKTLCEHLAAHNKGMQLVPTFLFKHIGCNLPDREGELVMIPVVVEPLIDHIIAVLYDATSNRVEVFDSKGLAVKDRSNSVRCSEKGLQLSDVVKGVIHKYGNEDTTLVENTVKHQYDAHNCGVYVMDYFERRCQGESHETIVANPLSYGTANHDRRVDFIRELIL